MALYTSFRRTRASRFLAAVSGYSATVVTSAAVSVAVIPIVISTSGAGGWSAIAVGQSVGSIAAVLIALGWGITGPALIARALPDERAQLVADSVVSRLWLSALVLPVAAIVAWISTPLYPVSALLAATNVATVGLGLVWYFVGVGSPRQLFILDTLPRALGSILAGGLLWATRSLELFAAVQLLFSCGAVAISIRASAGRCGDETNWVWSLRWSLLTIRQQMLPSATAIATSVYGALPTLAVAWLAPAGVGVYALAERLGRYVTMAVTPLHNWMQGWVPAAQDSSSINQRIRAAILAAITVGGGAGIALYLLGPVLGRLLGGGTISLDSMLIAGVAVAIAATTVSRCTGGACLIALNDAKSVAISSFVGAGTCVLALGVLVPPMGAIGAAMAMAMAEVTVLLYQIAALLTYLITGRGRSNRQAAMPVMRHARRNAGYYKNK